MGGVLLFGGSFNPVHIGHLIVARAVGEQLGADRVVLIPSAQPPHKHMAHLLEASHRLKMLRLAVRDDPCFEISDLEIQRTGPSYTLLTIQDYRQKLGKDTPLYWIIGADSLQELHTWYHVDELVRLCRVVTAMRPGFEQPDLSALGEILSQEQIKQLKADVLPTPLIDISATDIRQRIAAGRSIRYLVPESVRKYIEDNGIYR